MAFDSTVVLLIGAETGILDDSQYHRSLTAVGNAARTTTQFKYGTGSLTFDGAGDWIEAANSTDFTFGSNDFTVEGFFRFVSVNTNRAMMGRWDDNSVASNSSWLLLISSSTLTFRYSKADGSGYIATTATWAPTLGTWYHVAVDKSGSTVRLYVDGVVMGSNATITMPMRDSPNKFVIGAIGTLAAFSGFDFNGQVDEIRITNGIAKYGGAFTPPSVAFPRPGWTLVTSASAAPGVNGGTTAAVNTTGADLLVWGISYWAGGGTLNAPTDSKGNTWIPLTAHGPGQYATHRFWYAKNPIVGTSHTFTAAGSGIYPAQIVLAFSGAHLGAPFSLQSGNTTGGGASVASGSVTPGQNNALVVAGYGCETNPGNSAEALAPTMAMTNVGTAPTGRTVMGWLAQTIAAAVNPTWSWTGSAGVAVSTAVFLPSIANILVGATVASGIVMFAPVVEIVGVVGIWIGEGGGTIWVE